MLYAVISMKISELRPGTGKVNLTARVTEVGPPRDVNTKSGPMRVATAKVQDESGEIDLSVWNEDIELVKPGNTVTVENGYVSSFQGKMQLSAGRFGKLSVQ